MKAHLKAFGGALTVECEGADMKVLFEQIAAWQEVFTVKACGICNSSDVRFQFRLVNGKDKYYEVRCDHCRAEFRYGQRREIPTLYPKRNTEDNSARLPNGGWSKYVPADEPPNPPAQQPAAPGKPARR